MALRGDPPAGSDEWEAAEGGFTCALDLVSSVFSCINFRHGVLRIVDDRGSRLCVYFPPTTGVFLFFRLCSRTTGGLDFFFLAPTIGFLCPLILSFSGLLLHRYVVAECVPSFDSMILEVVARVVTNLI